MKQFNKTTSFHALVWQEDDLFVAKAVELDITSQGESEAEALKNLQEAVNLFFEGETLTYKSIKPLESVQLHTIRYA